MKNFTIVFATVMLLASHQNNGQEAPFGADLQTSTRGAFATVAIKQFSENPVKLGSKTQKNPSIAKERAIATKQQTTSSGSNVSASTFTQQLASIKVKSVTSGCAGSTVSVKFIAKNGNGNAQKFKNNSVYTLYLSNSTGSNFTAQGQPFSITANYENGSDEETTLIYSYTLPTGISGGTGYKIAIGSVGPTFNAVAGAGASSSFTISVPVAPSTPSPSNTTICAGSSNTTYTASASNATSYTWSVTGAGNTISGTGTTGTVIWNASFTGVATVSVVANRCGISAPSSTTVTVKPNLTPNVSIAVTAGAQASCVGASVTFTASPTNGGVTPSYQWKVNGTNAGTNSPTFTTSSLANNAAVKVVMTSSASPCLTTATATSNTIVVAVTPANTITLTSAPSSNNQTLCNPADFVTSTYTTTGATGANFSGLPSGVSGNWTSNVVTISGIPTVAGLFSYTVTLTGGCGAVYASGTVAINTTTWTGSWSNGAPTASVGAVISANYAENVDLTACILTVNNNAIVTIVAGRDCYITGAVTVQTGSSLTVQNNANLIQSGTVNANSGNITAKRINTSMRRLDYTYWSSPTKSANYSLKNFSPQTVSLPLGASRFYTLIESDNALVAFEPTTAYFDSANVAKGYCIRAPNNFPTNGAVSTFNAEFIGVPNNGSITIPVTYSGTSKGSNLIGNPYPSAIDALAFLQYTPDAGVTYPNAGTIYFWTHNTQGAESSNYASFNLSGGTASVLGGVIPNGIVQVGQGFLLKKTAGATAVFTNTMRVGNNQGQFFRTATTEKHRIWLNLDAVTTSVNQMMVGYVEGTTLGFDESYDGRLMFNGSAISSLINNENYGIQARPTPFENTDEVALNFKAATAGNYALSIDHVDGLFLGAQNIYLRDNLLNLTHNLKASAYSFTSEQGTFSNRFHIVYNNAALSNATPTFDANSVVVYKNDDKILGINAGKVIMSNVKIYDVRGRLIVEESNINASAVFLNNIKTNHEVLLVKITSVDNQVITKKVVY